jgi:hypothetical protein
MQGRRGCVNKGVDQVASFLALLQVPHLAFVTDAPVVKPRTPATPAAHLSHDGAVGSGKQNTCQPQCRECASTTNDFTVGHMRGTRSFTSKSAALWRRLGGATFMVDAFVRSDGGAGDDDPRGAASTSGVLSIALIDLAVCVRPYPSAGPPLWLRPRWQSEHGKGRRRSAC